MLRADDRVSQVERLDERLLECAFRVRRERNLPGNRCVADTHDLPHLMTQPLDGEAGIAENSCGEALLLPQKTNQKVLDTDVAVAELPRIVLRQHDHLPR